MRIQLTNGQVTGVRFEQPRPTISFRVAWDLLADPDIPPDVPDALLMLTELDRRGALTAAEKGRLRRRLRTHTSPLLELHRALCWGDHTPPPDQFWWFRPGEH